MLPLFQSSVPDSVMLGIVVISALLAVLTIVLMFTRLRQSAPAGEETQSPPFDPVLLGSAIIVLILAAVAYLSL